MDAVNMIGSLSRRIADREDGRSRDELVLLREFHARWCRLHAALNGMRGHELTAEDTRLMAEMSQGLIDQSNAIKAQQK